MMVLPAGNSNVGAIITELLHVQCTLSTGDLPTECLAEAQGMIKIWLFTYLMFITFLHSRYLSLCVKLRPVCEIQCLIHCVKNYTLCVKLNFVCKIAHCVYNCTF